MFVGKLESNRPLKRNLQYIDRKITLKLILKKLSCKMQKWRPLWLKYNKRKHLVLSDTNQYVK